MVVLARVEEEILVCFGIRLDEVSRLVSLAAAKTRGQRKRDSRPHPRQIWRAYSGPRG